MQSEKEVGHDEQGSRIFKSRRNKFHPPFLPRNPTTKKKVIVVYLSKIKQRREQHLFIW